MLLVVRGCRREEPSMRKRYTVVLSEPERARLHTLIGQGAGPARAPGARQSREMPGSSD
jgi:hypothetical protein